MSAPFIAPAVSMSEAMVVRITAEKGPLPEGMRTGRVLTLLGVAGGTQARLATDSSQEAVPR